MTRCCPFCGAESDLTTARCRDCKMALPAPSLAADDAEGDAEELVYELDDWPVAARVQVTSGLIERGVACRWEPGLTLVVAAVDEETAEQVLDYVEEAGLDEGWDEDDSGLLPSDAELEGGEGSEVDDDVAHAAMSDLFVAADRLMHEPSDDLVAAELGAAAALVDDSPPPYGIDPEMWERIRELAAMVLADLDEGAGEDAVARDARVLRDVLRPWV
ncbi:MAG TPA: hypothetical protein VHG90_00955 [Acidimicrobiales bacterium]|nr:hypothetical protein [Acidimicrobiales bacterium]